MQKRLSIVLGIIQVFVAIGALPAGYAMMAEPDGHGLGMTTSLLADSPFHSFLIPGILLFTVNGIFNIVAAVFSFLRKYYAWFLGVALGIAMLIWISVQVYSIGLNSVLQPVYFGIGILEIVLSLMLRKAGSVIKS